MDGTTIGIRALVIAHDPVTRDRVACELATAHFLVTTCDEGRQALALALTQPHEVVVTDSQLPGIDGYELCRVLRHDTATFRIPIVVMVEDHTDAACERAMRAGATAVLDRYCTPDVLVAAVHRASDT